MSARHKLNQTYFQGALIVAGVIAAIAGSWSLFFLLLVILLAISVHSGDIRLSGRR